MMHQRRNAAWNARYPRSRGPARYDVLRGFFHASLLLPIILFALLPGVTVVRFIPAMMAAILGFYGLATFAEFAEWRRRRRRVPLGDLPAGSEQFPCTLVLRQDVVYGVDEGQIAFVDGWLVFEGRETAFSVRASDVVRTYERGHPAFEWAGPHGVHRAVFRPLGRRFYGPWVEWPRTLSDIEGAPVLPPVTVSPSYHRPPVRLLGGLVLLIIGLATLPRALPTALFELALAFGFLFRAFQEARSLRRLRLLAEERTLILEKLGVAIRADLRRRRRRRALVRRARTP